MGIGFADSLQNRIATAGATHDAWVHSSKVSVVTS
jgi:hypothetical protein